MKIFGCLVSISFDFASIRKKGDAAYEILWHFSLKNSFLPIRSQFCRALFVGGSWDLILQVGLNRSLHSNSIGTIFLHKIGQKTALLTYKKKKKKVKHLIKVLKFCWYLIRFNSNFGPWTIFLKGKICPMRWSKIQSKWTIRLKSQLFDHHS